MPIHITDHFTAEEFACHSGEPYPLHRLDEDRTDGLTWGSSRLLPLCLVLEAIRFPFNTPVVIDSGFRSAAYDDRLYQKHLAELAAAGKQDDHLVAPASKSQHPKGTAADIRIEGWKPVDLHRLISRLYREGALPQLGGLGLYPNFVHVDVRARPSDNHLAMWGGSRDSNVV